MSNVTTAPEVTATTVREFYRSNEKAMARLSEAAQKTVQEGARGRLHAGVIKDYNSKRRVDKRYVLGASTAQAKTLREVAQARRAEVVALNLTGQRGPLSQEALDHLSGEEV